MTAKTLETRTFDRELGRRIEMTRKARNLTAKELAEAAAISAAAVCGYESGRTSCAPIVLRRIADALGVSVTVLVPKFTPCKSSEVFGEKSLPSS